MARKVVLADASPLISLARAGRLPWLRKLPLPLLDTGEASTAGIIVQARRAGLIAAAGPVFERLAQEGFHLGDDLIQAILAELGEH